MNLTILIPCKKDKFNLSLVVKQIKMEYPDLNILVVVDEAEDFDTSLKDRFSKTNYIIQKKKGYGSAIIEGINFINTDFFIIHNADGSFEIKKIKEMYDLTKSYDFIFCDRYTFDGGSDDDTFITYIGNKFFSAISRYLLNIKLNDVLYTHVLCNTNITKSFKLKQTDFTLCIELPYKVFSHQYSVKTISTHEKKRISGSKNVNELRDGFLILIYIFKTFLLKLININKFL